MADDYLSDREQEEALRNWWRENWRWILGGVVLGVGGLVGYWQWQDYRDTRALGAAKIYGEFRSAVESRNVDQAERLLADLADSHSGSAYTQQSRLALAKVRVDEGQFDEALTLLRAVIDSADDEELAQIAQLRAARLLIQQDKADEALAMLDAEKAGAFAAQVREVRGDALAAKNDNEAARAEYAAALAANADAQIDRTMLELKLQEVGGDASTPPSGATAAAAE